MIGKIINNKYEIIREIGRGGFGTVYRGKNINTQNAVAIKVERRKKNNEISLLRHEYNIMQYFRSERFCPKVLWYGTINHTPSIVMTLHGHSLENLKCKHKKLSQKTICILGKRIVNIIEYIHGKGIIHRDIKSENFLFGNTEKTNKLLYMVDFGLSKFYKNDNGHIGFKSNKAPCGTMRYISVNCHNGYELSRRDDLESVAYLLLYLFLNKLPWQGTNVCDDNQRNNIIMYNKVKLVEKHNDIMPNFLKRFLLYSKKLGFEETPNYNYLYNLFTYDK